jgi:outer membrane protein assembly factor BamB
MGFLIRKILFIMILICFLGGCNKSLIELTSEQDDYFYNMFGGTPSREFFVPVTVSDSLQLKWESDAYGSFRNSSPTIYNEFIFTSDQGGRIFVFNIETGKQVGMLKSSESIYSSPLLYSSLVIYAVVEENSNISQIIYYNHKEGMEEFYKEFEGRIISEMIALENGIIFLLENGNIYRLDLVGNIVWQSETKQFTRCSPSLKNNTIVFGNDAGEIISVNIEDGRIINRVKYEGIFAGAPTIDNDRVFISNYNGYVYSLELSTLKANWKFNTGTKILMTPAFDNEYVIIGNLKGSLAVVDKNNGELVWKKEYKGLFNATPLVTNNRIIIPDLFRAFHIIDKVSGDLIKSVKLDGRAKLTPILKDNTLFIGYDRGVLRAYEFVY